MLWATDLLWDDTAAVQPERTEAQLAATRVLLVTGDGPSREHALALLDRLRRAADAEGRTGVTIEALALQALALWRRGDRAAALTALERALRLAEPEGYVRLFADLGLPMARLLQEARSRAILPDYLAKLLSAFGSDFVSSAPGGATLPEPLTPRELDVVRLVAAGLTNREIGEQLVISVETVKRHVSNVCDKLGAGNRTEAAARARELDLLT